MIKRKILEIVDQSDYPGYEANAFAQQLDMQNTDSYKSLLKALNELENTYVLARDRKNRYFRCENLGYFKGTLKINPKGFGFVEADGQSFYIAKDHLNFALHGDIVMARKHAQTDHRSECEIVDIMEHRIKTVVGVIKKNDREMYFLPDSFMNGHSFFITNIKEFKLVNDTKVLLKIDSYGKTLKCHIEKVLGHKYDPGIDVLSVLMEHDIEPSFPEEVIREAAQISDEISENEIKNRRDLRNLQIITIDGEDAKDLDDAVSVQKTEDGYYLGVHIADVSYYVSQGSAIDREAYQRGTSVYVTDRVVPMLPHALCNGICSLLPRVDRLTLTCRMHIDKKGEIKDYQIFPSVIKTTERMTYTDVNKILAEDKKTVKKYQHIVPLCRDMQKLSNIIRKRRESLGNIDFDVKEAKIIVNDKGRPTDIVLRDRGKAERIIEDFMICANECVAMHNRWLEVPSIYRIHETPEPKKIREFSRMSRNLGYPLHANAKAVYPKQLQEFLDSTKECEEYPVLSAYLLRSMQKARYDAECLGHFGLALENYTHFTSPIRRYPDLIVHRMLRKYYFQQVYDIDEMKNDELWIEECAKHSSAQERKAIEAERDVEDMKKSEYMERYVGQAFDGIVSGITKFGMFVELENTVEGLVHINSLRDDHYHYDDHSKALIGRTTAKTYRMGQKVTVRVTGANHFKREVDFELLQRSRKKC